MGSDAASPENNRHHTEAYYSQVDWDDENLPRGKGDPDWYGYPGETADNPLPSVLYLTDKEAGVDLGEVPF